MNTTVMGMCCVCVACPSAYGGVVASDEFLVNSDRPHVQVGTPFTLVSDLPIALHATARGDGTDYFTVLAKRGVARVSAYSQMNRFRERSLDASDAGTAESPDIWGSSSSVSGIHHIPARERDEATPDHGDPERLESVRLAPIVLLVVFAVVGTVFRWLWGASIRAVIS